jgi:hypothetical protein
LTILHGVGGTYRKQRVHHLSPSTSVRRSSSCVEADMPLRAIPVPAVSSPRCSSHHLAGLDAMQREAAKPHEAAAPVHSRAPALVGLARAPRRQPEKATVD